MKREREVLPSRVAEYETNYVGSFSNRVFKCKTCNRKFHSFQALGGHRASHKKPRLMAGDANKDGKLLLGSPQKPKTHECSICGLEFATGPALGGHMRKHRAVNLNGNMQNSMTMSGNGISSLDSSPNKMNSGNKRVLDFFDLNLTPTENDMEYMKMERQLLWMIYYL